MVDASVDLFSWCDCSSEVDMLFVVFRLSRCIGVRRFRILGGQGLEYWGGGKGGKFPAGTCRRNDVDAT